MRHAGEPLASAWPCTTTEYVHVCTYKLAMQLGCDPLAIENSGTTSSISSSISSTIKDKMQKNWDVGCGLQLLARACPALAHLGL